MRYELSIYLLLVINNKFNNKLINSLRNWEFYFKLRVLLMNAY